MSDLKLVGGDPDTPVTCWACKKVIPEDSAGNVRPVPSGLLKLFCDECIKAELVGPVQLVQVLGTLEVVQDRHQGHCLHCGGQITARTSAAWRKAVRGPCPHCGRKGW